MKINDNFFSLPPYISTSWNNIRALHMKAGTLVVTLNDGDTINIPSLNRETIESIFTAHTHHLEKDISHIDLKQQHPLQGKMPNPFAHALLNPNPPEGFPVRLGFGAMDGFGTLLQHNPNQAKGPNLPKEILEKISAIAKIVTPEDSDSLPKAEPHCNCMYCQIARAISQSGDHNNEIEPQYEEEVITPEDLKFQQWDINQTGESLFAVTNKLDSQEKYSVYLGHPVGCTCGNDGCEHILAVLRG